MMKALTGTFFVTLSVFATAQEYSCKSDIVTNEISITTNNDEIFYGFPYWEGFLLTLKGLYTEFSDMEYSLNQCPYENLTTTGVHCTLASIAGGYDSNTSFKIKVLDDVDISENPTSFSALLIPDNKSEKTHHLDCLKTKSKN